MRSIAATQPRGREPAVKIPSYALLRSAHMLFQACYRSLPSVFPCHEERVTELDGILLLAAARLPSARARGESELPPRRDLAALKALRGSGYGHNSLPPRQMHTHM